METGSDGRFYDWHFDHNHNGQLDMDELMTYEDVTFGHRDEYGSGRRDASGLRGILLGIGFFLGVPILTAISPLFGIILLIVLVFL